MPPNKGGRGGKGGKGGGGGGASTARPSSWKVLNVPVGAPDKRRAERGGDGAHGGAEVAEGPKGGRAEGAEGGGEEAAGGGGDA